jgi:glutamyl-tRNA synthetase
MTFWRAQERARAAGGDFILRIEDIDGARCRPEFREAIMDDLKWFGLAWQEGPDVGGPFAPYLQSERRSQYLFALQELVRAGHVYPCSCSRKDVAEAAAAPHDENEEPIYPGTCRSARAGALAAPVQPAGVNWRFRVPAAEEMRFLDLHLGEQRAVAGRDFGDFIVWRRDDVPAYQLAVMVDDAAMRVTEVVRGEDLLVSTFRQILLYRALGKEPPAFFHAALVVDELGRRLAKRHASLSLRALRDSGVSPEEVRAKYANF